MDSQTFGSYIKELRKERNLTTRQVELYSGVSSSYLSLIENDKRGIPSPAVLKKLAKVYKVSYYDLMHKAGHIDNTEAPIASAAQISEDCSHSYTAAFIVCAKRFFRNNDVSMYDKEEAFRNVTEFYWESRKK